jgi:Na+/pantothenate symporter
MKQVPIYAEFHFHFSSGQITIHLLLMHLISPLSQSIVPDLHSIVQKISLQSGAKFLLITSVAWQHCAATQSESAAQVILSTTEGCKFLTLRLIANTMTAKTMIANTSPVSGLLIH